MSQGCVFLFVRAFKSAELLSGEISLGRDREEAESVRRTHADTFVLIHVNAPRRRQEYREEAGGSIREPHTMERESKHLLITIYRPSI